MNNYEAALRVELLSLKARQAIVTGFIYNSSMHIEDKLLQGQIDAIEAELEEQANTPTLEEGHEYD